MDEKRRYEELSGSNRLESRDMFTLEGGCQMAYGCDSFVCATKRSGAAGICQDAYCRHGVGPESSLPNPGTDIN